MSAHDYFEGTLGSLQNADEGTQEQVRSHLLSEVEDFHQQHGNLPLRELTDPQSLSLGGQMLHGEIAGSDGLTVISRSRGPNPGIFIKDDDGNTLLRIDDGTVTFNTDDHKRVEIDQFGHREEQQLLWK